MPDFDLSPYADQLDGGPDAHFVDTHLAPDQPRAEPLIVRHADGQPVFIIQADGSLRPFHQEPNPNAPPTIVGFGRLPT